MESHIKVVLSGLLMVFSVTVSSLDISPPEPIMPDEWFPAEILVFGDSLSDSHSRHSTYNLLRTLKGETDIGADGENRRPMDLSAIIGRRSTIDNFRANIELSSQELKREGKEKSRIGRFVQTVKINTLKLVGSLLAGVLKWVDETEDKLDLSISESLQDVIDHLDSQLNELDELNQPEEPEEPEEQGETSFVSKALMNLKGKLLFLQRIVDQDLEDLLLEFTEEQLIDIVGKFGNLIPLIPDKEYYVTGKWTAGVELDQVWVEYLVKMMSTPEHSVRLDNRAMAGSWTLCAPGKLSRMDAFRETATNLKHGATLLFLGSLIPPCEGLVVQSYLNERRNRFTERYGKTPEMGDQLIPDDTLVVFFNSANDFLNKWSDPDDVAQEYASDVWNILAAGAQRVAVVTLPDISKTPRFANSRDKQLLSDNIKRYNESLVMRLNLLREEFGSENSHRVMTIDGFQIFQELLSNTEFWDVENPLLDIPIPGMDEEDSVVEAVRKESEENKDFVTTELTENNAFSDNWRIRSDLKKTGGSRKVFFADSVHPSAEGHYELSAKACLLMSQKHNIPCNPANYSYQQAVDDSLKRNITAHEEL